MQEETLEGAGILGAEEQSSQRTIGTRIIQTIPCFPPISYGLLLFHTPKLITEQWFYWNSTCTQYPVQVLSPGDQALPRAHAHLTWSCRKVSPALQSPHSPTLQKAHRDS